jgi:hypothetical protein
MTFKEQLNWYKRGYADWQQGKPNRFNENHPRDFEGGIDAWCEAQWHYNNGNLSAAMDEARRAA